MNNLKSPLIVIVGPTASGKSGLAICIAEQYDGEVISADSRAIYRGLSIGTAKPTIHERKGIPHWGIDIVDPGDRFTAADFKQYAQQKISEIRSRGRVPIVVGGTGLYVDTVVYDFEFPIEGVDVERRDSFMEQEMEQLYKYCENNNIILPKNDKNKRHVVNAILRNGREGKRKYRLDENIIIVGITTEKDILRKRIEARAETIFSQSVTNEALIAAQNYGWDTEAMTGNIYPLIRRFTNKEITIDRAKELFITLDWRLAKRQLTWLKRNSDIKWSTLEDAHTNIAHWLDKMNKS